MKFRVHDFKDNVNEPFQATVVLKSFSVLDAVPRTYYNTVHAVGQQSRQYPLLQWVRGACLGYAFVSMLR